MSLPLGWWLDLEFMPFWKAGVLFALLAAIITFMGIRSLAGLPPVRKWVAIAIRLLVIAILVLLVGGARWTREHKVVELLVLRDNSQSAKELYQGYPGKNLSDSLDDYLKAASEPDRKHEKDDCIGVISFSNDAYVDALSNTTLDLSGRGERNAGPATDIGMGIQMALANFRRDAMRRMLLISDGLDNMGDLETAILAAKAQKVPIDVMPLSFSVGDEVVIERLTAPSWRRESDTFEITVRLASTNPKPVSGTLKVYEGAQQLVARPITIDQATYNDEGKLEPRRHIERVRVPPLNKGGVRRFKAVFEPDVWNPRGGVAEGSAGGDTLRQNNEKTAFTFVRGQGRVLYVDNAPGNAGQYLQQALKAEGVDIYRAAASAVPEDLVQLQQYDAIVLNNVPRGRGGLSEKQGAMLARYVNDFGGGIIMLGGPESMGAGSWQGSKLEEVMPVSFDVPPERQIPKGALVLIIHSIEMSNGRFYAEQCALKAVEALSAQDEVGVITYGWNGGGSIWDYELAPKGDGLKVNSAIKRMQPGDMASFDDCLGLAFADRGNGAPCLKTSDAANKHIIIISDGDPTAPAKDLMNQIRAAGISISTITVNPHPSYDAMITMPRDAAPGGRMYGPIAEKDYATLPQIFIKEAAVVRRTLIQERLNTPFVVKRAQGSELVKEIPQPPPIRGLVLSTRKPEAIVPLVADVDGHDDPLMAHWQAGLGKAAVFASDAGPMWDDLWLNPAYAAKYAKLFAQLVRGVSKPPMSQDFVVTTERRGDKAVVTVEATNKSAGFANFLSIGGTVVDPDVGEHKIQLVQTGPGIYVGEFPTSKQGDYVVSLQYEDERKQKGLLASGVSVDDSPEMRELRSNDALLRRIAEETGGRVLAPFDSEKADLFSRQNLQHTSSPMPVWDILLKILLPLLLLDVACRRLAWDWASIRRLAKATADRVRAFTASRQVKSEQTLDALRRVREDTESKLKTADQPTPQPPKPPPMQADVRFEAREEAADITGSLQSKPVQKRAAPPESAPKSAATGAGTMEGLLQAKRRARKQIEEREKEE